MATKSTQRLESVAGLSLDDPENTKTHDRRANLAWDIAGRTGMGIEKAAQLAEIAGRIHAGEKMAPSLLATFEDRKQLVARFAEIEERENAALAAQIERDRLTANRDAIAARIEGERVQLAELGKITEDFVLSQYEFLRRNDPGLRNHALSLGQTIASARCAEGIIGRLLKRLTAELAEANEALDEAEKPAKSA